MYIKKLRIKNYKSFLDSGDITVDGNVFAFIGQNNTGKSAVLDAIQCMFPSGTKKIIQSDFHVGTSGDIEIYIEFNGVTDSYLEEILFSNKIEKQLKKVEKLKLDIREDSNAKDLKKLKDEELKIEDIRTKCLNDVKDKYKILNEVFKVMLVAKKGNKSVTKKYYIDSDNEVEVSESDLKALLPQIKVIPAIRDPKNESTAGSNSYLKELIQMLDDEIQTNISIEGNSISYNELNKVIAEETKDRCKSLGEQITTFYNKAIGSEDYKVIIHSDVNIAKGTTYTTRIKDINTEVESDILNCGTGYQSMIILSILETYVDISNKLARYILLIEEPEIYLHPTLQRKMIDTLISISKKNQVIFTSHSPITVSKLSKEQIVLVKKKEGKATLEKINPQIVIDELGIKSDDILNNKAIIFVEGKDDKTIFRLILEKLEPGLSEKINVIDAGNCKNLKFYANAQMLINNRFVIPTLIVRDADAKEQGVRREELIAEIINSRNIEPTNEVKEKIRESVKVLEQYSLEAYFIDEKLLGDLNIENELICNIVNCYECQYNYYSNEVHNNRMKSEILTKWYQPKYCLEKFDDKFNATQVEQIERHNQIYEEKWREFEKCKECTNSNIEHYIEGRRILNIYTKKLKIGKKDFMVECIRDKTIEELKETKLVEIINMIEEFIARVSE